MLSRDSTYRIGFRNQKYELFFQGYLLMIMIFFLTTNRLSRISKKLGTQQPDTKWIISWRKGANLSSFQSIWHFQFFLVLKLYFERKNNNLFRFALENCKVCADSDCTGESIDIIKNACLDDVELNSFVSMPLSTSSSTNDYINTVDSEFSFQLIEMTLFKFPYSDESK